MEFGKVTSIVSNFKRFRITLRQLKMNLLIVGLSGVTNGGKTMLAKSLMNVLPVGTKLIKQDDYFLPEDSALHIPSLGGINHHNWEVISAIDMDKMMTDIGIIVSESEGFHSTKFVLPQISDIKDPDFPVIEPSTLRKTLSTLDSAEEVKRIVIIEGFILFDDPRVRDLCQLKIFVTLSKEESARRRARRVYNPPDPPGYFEACVWPLYEAHLERVKQFQDIHLYDGTDKIENIFLSVLRKILCAAIT